MHVFVLCEEKNKTPHKEAEARLVWWLKWYFSISWDAQALIPRFLFWGGGVRALTNSLILVDSDFPLNAMIKNVHFLFFFSYTTSFNFQKTLGWYYKHPWQSMGQNVAFPVCTAVRECLKIKQAFIMFRSYPDNNQLMPPPLFHLS